MPPLVNLSDRETVDLHAPWWSPHKDESGRNKERVVVYAQMTEGNDGVIAYLRDELRHATSGEAPEQGSMF